MPRCGCRFGLWPPFVWLSTKHPVSRRRIWNASWSCQLEFFCEAFSKLTQDVVHFGSSFGTIGIIAECLLCGIHPPSIHHGPPEATGSLPNSLMFFYLSALIALPRNEHARLCLGFAERRGDVRCGGRRERGARLHDELLARPQTMRGVLPADQGQARGIGGCCCTPSAVEASGLTKYSECIRLYLQVCH